MWSQPPVPVTCHQDQVHIVELLWQMWPDMPTYGWKASQFVDLLSYCTISTPHIMEKVSPLGALTENISMRQNFPLTKGRCVHVQCVLVLMSRRSTPE